MSNEQRPPLPPSLIQNLAEIVELPLPEERLAKVIEAFRNFITEQRKLDKLELADVDPAMTYDPRWE